MKPHCPRCGKETEENFPLRRGDKVYTGGCRDCSEEEKPRIKPRRIDIEPCRTSDLYLVILVGDLESGKGRASEWLHVSRDEVMELAASLHLLKMEILEDELRGELDNADYNDRR